jgi:Flp pilus assembly protein TadD
LRLDQNFTPALVNLADLDRMRGLDQEGVELLRKATSIDPNNADIRHSLGLALVRQHNYADALPELRQASEFAPDNARYAYVYAIALNSIGAGASAMELLENTHKRHPADRDTLLALVSIARDTGDFATALLHARELVTLYPTDMQLRMLVLDLEKRQIHWDVSSACSDPKDLSALASTAALIRWPLRSPRNPTLAELSAGMRMAA